MAYQPILHGTSPGDGTGESPFNAAVKINANFVELYAADAAEIAARSAAVAQEVNDRNAAIAAAGEFTTAGVLVWPGNTAETVTWESPGIVGSITTSYNGKTYTKTFSGSPITSVVVTDGTTTWTKSFTYDVYGNIATISTWA